MASTEPPGGNGTMILIGPDGQLCASAASGASAASAGMAASKTRRLDNFAIAHSPDHLFSRRSPLPDMPAHRDGHSLAKILATRRVLP